MGLLDTEGLSFKGEVQTVTNQEREGVQKEARDFGGRVLVTSNYKYINVFKVFCGSKSPTKWKVSERLQSSSVGPSEARLKEY